MQKQVSAPDFEVDAALWNPDLAPVSPGDRRWGKWDIAALWIGMAVCIPTYQLASGLIAGGMNWWQAILTILLGNLPGPLQLFLVFRICHCLRPAPHCSKRHR